jgi:phage baseplate assembly protein W
MATITQVAPLFATISSQLSTSYSVQLMTSGNNGAVLFEMTASEPAADLDITQSGTLTATGTLNDGVYTAQGTTADAHGNTGVWAFQLTVIGPYTPQTTVTPASPAETTGTVIAVPFQIDPATGGVATLSDYYSIIQQNVMSFLLTSAFSRVMNPGYGGSVENLVFSPIQTVNGQAQSDLMRALVAAEPEISVQSVQIVPLQGSAGGLAVNVAYTVPPSSAQTNVTITTGGGVTQVISS